MGAKNARHKRKCKGKKVFYSREAAGAALSAIRDIYGDYLLSIYKCPYCRKYHLGHLPKRVRQSLRDRRKK